MTREFEMLKQQKTDLVKENIRLKNLICDLEEEITRLKRYVEKFKPYEGYDIYP